MLQILIVLILPALPVMVRLPPTVATNEMMAQANRLVAGSSDATLGIASWTTATLPNSCEDINTNKEMPNTDEKDWNGRSPTILFLSM